MPQAHERDTVRKSINSKFADLKNSGKQAQKVLAKYKEVLAHQTETADTTITELFPVYSAMFHNSGHHRRHATLTVDRDGTEGSVEKLGLDRELKNLVKPSTFKWQIEMLRKKEEVRISPIRSLPHLWLVWLAFR